MAGRTVAEKILARTSGNSGAKAGDVVEAYPDVAMSHENTYLVNKAFTEFQLERPWDPDKIVIVLDHRSPANTAETASVHASIRTIVKDFGIKNFFDVGEGICHQLMIEQGIVRPGQLVIGADSHTTTAGAVGAFGTGIGATEMAGVWATGHLWLKVPETTLVSMSGHLKTAVYAKDIALRLAAKLGPSGADYKCLEFGGESLLEISISSRMVLCNMAAEMGAKTSIVPADSTVAARSPECAGADGVSCRSDPDAKYSDKLDIDVGAVTPMVSGPNRIEDAASVERFEDVKIDQAFIGSCTNGRLEDLIAASRILKGRKVAPGVRLIVVPASRQVLTDALDMGVAQIILASGGTLLPPGCGPCLGAHEGVLGVGEVCISSSNRNFRGRMGSENAEIYLASPATVAASAIEGKITDPRRLTRDDL